MKLENIQDDESPKGDETKEMELKPCTKKFEVKKAKEYTGVINPCTTCNQFGTYVMFGHKYICDEYEVEE